MNYTLKLMISFVLISVVLIVGCVEQGVFFPTKEVVYDKEILEEFNKSEWIPVLVRLKDGSGIKIEGTKEQRVALLKQRDEWFKPKIVEVISTLSKEEFELTHTYSTEFRGKINNNGFEKLINNPTVKEIIWEKGPFPHTTNDN